MEGSLRYRSNSRYAVACDPSRVRGVAGSLSEMLAEGTDGYAKARTRIEEILVFGVLLADLYNSGGAHWSSNVHV